jgi:acyl transferase domain-containing protein
VPFSGGATNPEAFWKLIKDGVDVITEIPSDRFNRDGLYAPEAGTPGKVVARFGGFLENVDKFDA